MPPANLSPPKRPTSPEQPATVRLSPEYKLVIPEELRDQGGLVPRQELMPMMIHGHLTLIPVYPLSYYKGILKGINTEGLRDKKDRDL